MTCAVISALLFLPLCLAGQTRYDLLLQGGHVIDPKNGTSAGRDVAIKDGLVAAIGQGLDPAAARKVVNLAGLYVTPGLVDIHVHVYAGTGERDSYAGDNSVYPDGFTFRAGVTTVADAGCAGWRNFEDFKDHVIDRSRTRVLAFLNIVGAGMRGPKFENVLEDMLSAPAVETAKKHPGLIVGIKTAHYAGPDWTPVERAVAAGTAAGIPVMVDFGTDHPERPIEELLGKKLRPGDIYTHCYSGVRRELVDGSVNPGMIEGRRRGLIFDVGHGAGSFAFRIAVPAVRQGFLPDVISTDLHIASMNAGMKDMLNVMDKFLAMGLTLDDVIRRSTWNPARAIRHEELGHLSVGAPADVAVLRLENGDFGFTDAYGARLKGKHKLTCELTLRDGKVVYDLNGLTRPDWTTLPPDHKQVGDPAWDAVSPVRPPLSPPPGRALAQGPAPENRIVLDLETGPGNPRNSEGAFLELAGGRLMFAYTRFTGGGDDNASADIAAVYSADAGLSWSSPPEIVVKNDAAENVMSVSLLRLRDGRIGLFYLKKNGLDDCRLWLRLSSDEARTWGAAVPAIPAPGYFVVNNDRIIQLGGGRLVAPAAYHRLTGADRHDMKNFDPRAVALFFLSDDAGLTWRESASWWALPAATRTGLQEPGAVELKDGTLYGWARTDQGCQYEMTSIDGGETWTSPRPSPFKSPNSPLSLKRIPGTDVLLAIWNDHSGRFPFPAGHSLYGGRTPLVSAISRDEGRTWQGFRELENDPRAGYCYTAIGFLGQHAFLAYWMAESKAGATVTRLRLRRIALDWFAPREALFP